MFPITYFHNNIVFNDQGHAFAIYSLPQLPFNFLSEEHKKSVLGNFEQFLHGYVGIGQVLYLVNPIEFDEGRYLKSAGIGRLSAELLKESHRHAVAAQVYSQNIHAWKREVYLVLQLPVTGWGKTAVKTTFRELRESIIETVLNVKRQNVTPKLIKEAESLERELYFQHKNTLGLSKIGYIDLDKIIRRNLHRGWEIPPPLPPRKSGTVDRGMILALGDGIVFEEKTNCMRFISPDGKEHWQALMTLVDVPKEIPELNFEWVAGLNFLSQPVDAVIHFASQPSFEASRQLRFKRGMLKDQIKEYEKGGEETTLDVDWANEEARVLESKLSSGMSLSKIGCTLAVWAPDLEQLQSAAKQVIQHYQSSYLRFVRAPGDQVKMFYSFIPGGRPAGPLIECDPGYIAVSGIQAGFEVGDYDGFIIGHILNGIPVLFNPGDAMQRDFPGTTVITGILGGGKSILRKTLVYLASLKGARVFTIDPKNEDFVFAELPFKTRQIDLSYTGGARINPLKVSPDPMRSRDIARDYLGIILAVGDNEARKLVISESLEKVFTLPEARQNLLTVTDYLSSYNDPDKEKTNEARRCARLLESYKKSSLGQLVFTSETTINEGAEQITVCNLSELPLPKKDSNTPMTESERQAVGLMYLTAALARETMFRTKAKLKVFSCDEAWALMDIPEGARLISELVRMSRSFGIIPILVTQNGTDIKDKSIRNNIGYVYCFRARDSDEIKGNAELLQIDGNSDEVYQTFRNLETGCCIARDPEGRAGVVNIVPMPEYLLRIFSTRPGEREVAAVK